MDRKLTKQEVKGIRVTLGLTQQEFADLLGISLSHLQRTEMVRGNFNYDVSPKLDQLIKNKLVQMEMDLEEILELSKKGGN